MSGTIALLKLAAAWLTSTTPVPAPSPEPYRFRADDIVQIRIHEDRRVNADILIDKDGILNSPLLAPMKVKGMTILELQKFLTESYSQVLSIKDPKVSVLIVFACPRKF